MDTLESKEQLKMRVEKATRQRLRGKAETEIQKELSKVFETLKTGPRTYAEYKSAPMEVQTYWEFAMSKAVDRVLQENQVEQKSAAQKKDSDISRMWTGQTTEEETAVCKATAEEFLSKYQHFTRIPENSAAIADRMRTKHLSPHQLSSFVKAFEELAVEGRLILNGKIAGICEDTAVGGHELRTHKDLHRFLQPTSTAEQIERREIGKMSADDFKKEYLQEAGVPYHIQARMKRAADTLVAWHPDFVITDGNIELIVRWISENKLQYDMNGFEAAYQTLSKSGKLELRSGAISHAGETTMTNFEPRETGAPKLPDKASLAAKIRNMSSNQLADFFRNNEGARKAVDAM